MMTPTPLIELFSQSIDTISFNVPEAPRGKARPRVVRNASHVYTPDPFGWCASVTGYALKAVGTSRWILTEEPVRLKVDIVRRIPIGASKKKTAKMLGKRVGTKPDLINIIAAICDSLEHVVYKNDLQVAQVEATRIWGTEHLTMITVSKIDVDS